MLKTHQHIRQALVELLDDKPFRAIAVQEIIEKAQVNRTTFYRYYSGKSDLAGKMIADFKRLLKQRLVERFSSNNLDLFYLQAIPQMFDQRRTLLALWKIDTPRHNFYR